MKLIYTFYEFIYENNLNFNHTFPKLFGVTQFGLVQVTFYLIGLFERLVAIVALQRFRHVHGMHGNNVFAVNVFVYVSLITARRTDGAKMGS